MLLIPRQEDHKGDFSVCCMCIIFVSNAGTRVVLAAEEWHICEDSIKELTYDELRVRIVGVYALHFSS